MTGRKKDDRSSTPGQNIETPSRYYISLTKYSVQSIQRCKPVNLPTQSTNPCQLPKRNAFLDSLAHTQENILKTRLWFTLITWTSLSSFIANYLHLDCLSHSLHQTQAVFFLSSFHPSFLVFLLPPPLVHLFSQSSLSLLVVNQMIDYTHHADHMRSHYTTL